MQIFRRPIPAFAAAFLFMAVPYSFGAGFAIVEQSASSIGSAFSDNGAATDDPSAMYFNPAGMSAVEGSELTLGGHVIMPTFEFNNSGSAFLPAGLPVSGGDGGNGGEAAFVPNAYYKADANDKAAWGIGITAPYGLTTEYDSSWVGRYHAIKTELINLNINPGVSYKISDKVAVGAGVSASYVEADLTSAIDFGTILGIAPQALDGRARIEGDDWAAGCNLGLLITPREECALSLSYRSKIEHTLEGDASFQVPGPARALQAMNMFVNTSGKADLTLPQTAAIGLAHTFAKKFTAMADVMWTGWSDFDELRVKYGSSQPDSVTDESWEDTWRYALGLQYQHTDKLALRIGGAYDETPVPDAAHRTPRIPDADRTWLSLGAGYRLNENLSIDLGYTHLFINDSRVQMLGTTGDYLNGSYEGSVDIASIQASWKF
ncbi:MAG: OmpP1/FadL family transporter [Kiritimatiellia bacterium]